MLSCPFLLVPFISAGSDFASNIIFIETKYTSLLHACTPMSITNLNAFNFNTSIIMLYSVVCSSLACAVCGLLFPAL